MNIWKHGDIITAAKLNAMEAGIAENAENINTLAGEKQDVLAFDTAPTSGSTNPVTSNGVYNALLNKANNSTTLEGYGIIDAYTSDETDVAIAAAVGNLDSSDSEETGKYVTAVSETDGIITVSKEAGDTTPTSASEKMITSGAVFTALAGKQDTLTFDAAPTSNSSNPVTSAGVYTALSTKVNASAIGSSGGVAELDANGKVPSSQLPSYVDDIVEGYYRTSDGKFYKESAYETEIEGETGKIYVSLDTNLPYRWTGSTFTEIPWGLVLGETSSTAYRGDRGKTAYDHATNKGDEFSSDLYKITTNSEGHVTAATSVLKSTVPSVFVAKTGYAYNNEYAVGYDRNGHLSVNIPIETDWNLELGTLMITSTDLDDYINPGNWYCDNSTILSSSLSNCPVTGIPFNLKVYQVLDTLIIQELIDDYGNKYLRKGTLETAVWSFSDWNNDLGNVATINQNVDTATDSYDEEDYLIWKGKLYKATASISSGDTLSTQTNIVSTTIADELKSIKSNSGFSVASNAGAHNSIYRGYYLGSSVTAKQWDEISNGTFEDLFIGDYWIINGTTYVIAAFDYWYGFGATNSDARASCSDHHIVLTTVEYDARIGKSVMYNSNVTDTQGYYGSYLRNTGLNTAKESIDEDFGSEHILTHKSYFCNSTKSGSSSVKYEVSNILTDSTVDLMNEVMVFGTHFYKSPPVFTETAVPQMQTIDNTQLPLFVLDRSKILFTQFGYEYPWWLRDYAQKNYICVDVSGSFHTEVKSANWAIRPTFGIIG